MFKLSRSLFSSRQVISLRTAAGAFPVIVGLLLLGIIAAGVEWYISTRPPENVPAAGGVKEKTTEQYFQDDLDAIVSSLSKAVESKTIDDAGVADLKGAVESLSGYSDDLSGKPEVKAKLVALVLQYLPKIAPLLEKITGIPELEAKLKPILTTLDTALKLFQ